LLGGTQGHRQCHHSIQRIRLPIQLQHKLCVYLVPFSRYSQPFFEVADFDPPHLHLAPRQGVIPVKFRGDLWHRKTRVPGWAIVWCCLCDLTFSRFSRTPTCDGQTDGRTDTGPRLVPPMHSIIASRGKNWWFSQKII